MSGIMDALGGMFNGMGRAETSAASGTAQPAAPQNQSSDPTDVIGGLMGGSGGGGGGGGGGIMSGAGALAAMADGDLSGSHCYADSDLPDPAGKALGGAFGGFGNSLVATASGTAQPAPSSSASSTAGNQSNVQHLMQANQGEAGVPDNVGNVGTNAFNMTANPAADADFQEPGGEAHWTLREENDFILAKNQRTGQLYKLKTEPLSPQEKKEAEAQHGAGPLGANDPNRIHSQMQDGDLQGNKLDDYIRNNLSQAYDSSFKKIDDAKRVGEVSRAAQVVSNQEQPSLLKNKNPVAPTATIVPSGTVITDTRGNPSMVSTGSDRALDMLKPSYHDGDLGKTDPLYADADLTQYQPDPNPYPVAMVPPPQGPKSMDELMGSIGNSKKAAIGGRILSSLDKKFKGKRKK